MNYDIYGNFTSRIIESFDDTSDNDINNILKLNNNQILSTLTDLSDDDLAPIINNLKTIQIIQLLQKLNGNQIIELFARFSTEMINNFIKLLRATDIITIFNKLDVNQRDQLLSSISNGEKISSDLLNKLKSGKINGIQLLAYLNHNEQQPTIKTKPANEFICPYYSCNDCYNLLLDVNNECSEDCKINCSYYNNLK